VKFTVKSFPDHVFNARIARRAGVMDKILRAEHIELDVQNNNMELSPGMIAEAMIGLYAGPNAFVVPKGAVVNSTEGVYMIEDSTGFVKKVPVRVGRVTDSLAEVFGKTLTPGRIFVSKGTEEMRNGTIIN
jgi:membrane fusion protein (multidrug efflux system)